MTIKRTPEDWARLLEKAKGAVAAGDISPTLRAVSDYLGIKYRTVQTAVKNYDSEYLDELKRLSPRIETAPDPGDIHQEKTANTWAINARHPEIHTIDQLLDYCQVDRSVWMIDGDPGRGPVLNSWPTTAKKKKTNLTYTTTHDAEGNPRTLIEGGVYSDGELTSKTNLQIKVRLRRINPIAVIPVIKPLEVSNPPKLKKGRKPSKDIRRVLFIADPHFGFSRHVHRGELTPIHDRRVLDIALQIAETEQLDDVTFLGDLLDLSEWSTRWVTTPEFYWTTQPTLIEAHFWLRKFREAHPGATMDNIEGNHARFKDAIINNLLAAYELRAVDELDLGPAISLPKLLALHDLNIGFIDGYKTGEAEKWFSDRILATHNDSASGAPGATARKVAGVNLFTTIFGHIHRRELVTVKVETRQGPITHTAVCPGCACRIDAIVPGNKKRQQWQQGVALMDYSPGDIAPPRFDLIEVHEGRAVYNGMLLEARESDKEIDAFIGAQMEKIQ